MSNLSVGQGTPSDHITFTRVLPLKLKEADFKQCFYAIQTLMAIFFDIDTCPAYYRQECLHKQLRGIVEEPLYCLFNDLFFVKVMKAVAFWIGLLMLILMDSWTHDCFLI